MITFEEAKTIVLQNTTATGSETVPLTEALGRVLARDAAADSDIPFRDNSAMDGFAVLAADIAAASETAPARLEVIETIPAGSVPTRAVSPGKAIRIMTGAIMPAGADTVVMVEDTAPAGADGVLIKKTVALGRNIRRAGEDVAAGQTVLRAGTRLRPADLGMLAACGHASVDVARRPKVAIFSTGDEIIDPSQPAAAGKVRNSNSYSLFAQCIEAGAEPHMLGVVQDRRDAVADALRSAAETHDIVMTSGGVSAGDFDEVSKAIGELGEVFFHKVRIKPGKPFVFGRIGGALALGMPGNPVSVMICFEMFARPMMLKMMGAADIERPMMRGALDYDFSERMGGRMHVQRGIATSEGGRWSIGTTGPQGSGILSSMVLANCLFIVRPDAPPPRKGDEVDFFLI